MPASMTITTSTEFMSNYKQVELLDQTKKFQAFQTHDGHTVFFGIDTNDQLHAIVETSGSQHAWSKTTITAKLGGKVKTFAGSQNAMGQIALSVVISAPDGSDSLYTTSALPNGNLAWIKEDFAWTAVTDDRQSAKNPKLVIAECQVYVGASGGVTNIVDTDDGSGLVARYWIDPRGAPVWTPRQLSFDLSADGNDKTALGRKKGDPVDGAYTMGDLAGVTQFVYTPVSNFFSRTVPPNPTNFDLSDTGLNGSNAAFAACPAVLDSDATDIYLAGDGKLYYLASDNQAQMAKPLEIIVDPIFQTMRDLHAATDGKKVVVWGLNAADEIFYTSCAVDNIIHGSSWTPPLPLRSGVSEISQYISGTHGGLTIFGNIGGGRVVKGIQDPKSSRWLFTDIELPAADPAANAIKQLSFTTALHVTDSNNNPKPNTDVVLTPAARTNVYINGLFYALDGTSVTIPTDANGTITIVEWVDEMSGTNFNAYTTDQSQAVALHPLQAPLERSKILSTTAGLNSAQIQGTDRKMKPLLPGDVSTNDRKALAQSLADLSKVNDSISSKVTVSGPKAGLEAAPATTVELSSPIDYIEVAWGDLVQAVEHFGEYVVKLVKDAASEIWHFVVTIGDAVYGFVVDTVEKVAGALKSIWHAIVKGLEDLWDFLKFLFAWEDMARTKAVFKQMVKIFFDKMGTDIQTAKHTIDDAIGNAEDTINDWANAGSHPSLGSHDSPLDATLSGVKQNSGTKSAPGQMLQHHFQSNVKSSNVPQRDPQVSEQPSWSGLTDLSDFTEHEQQTILDLKDQFKHLLMTASGDQTNPDISQILKKIVADIAVAALELFKLGADKILDFLTLLVEEIYAILDAPMEIPIVSDILKDLFDIELPSVLDILCYVVAIPATLGYKVLNGTAPYPSDGDDTYSKITSANTYAELKAAYGETGDEITLSDEAKAVVFETTYLASGVATAINGILVILDEETDDGLSTILATPKSVTSTLASISAGAGSLFKLQIPVQNAAIKDFSKALTIIGFVSTVGFAVAPKVVAKVKGISGESELKALGSTIKTVSQGVTAVLSFIGLVPPVYHIYEILEDGSADPAVAALSISDSIQAMTGKVGKIVGFAALVDQEEISKQVLVIIQGVFIAITAGIQIGEAASEAVIEAN